MGAKSAIEWTDATWTPIRARVKPDALQIARAKGYSSLVQILEARKPNGELRTPPGRLGPHCEHVSPGCEHCYSETNGARCLPANGTGLPFDRRARDLVELFVDEKILAQPLHWRTSQRIFVCSQTDLFAEFVTDEMIDRVFAAMALCPQHTFQVLTKRAKRMRNWVTDDGSVDDESMRNRLDEAAARYFEACHANMNPPERWPLPNVWLGVSVEDQQRADERIPLLLQTPAAVRFLSVEPLLGPVDLARLRRAGHSGWDDCLGRRRHRGPSVFDVEEGIDWVIVGGESGPGARPCDVKWIRSIVAQCAAAGVACFVKQLGAFAHRDEGMTLHLKDRKGGDSEEWPADLRVRQIPEPRP